MDEYMTALRELSWWLGDYRDVALDPRAITAPITGIKQQANRGVKRIKASGCIDLMNTVDTHLYNLYKHSTGFLRMEEKLPGYSDEEYVAMRLVSEPRRFQKIKDMGYMHLYQRNDEERVASDFYRKTSGSDAIANLHKGLSLVLEATDQIPTEKMSAALVKLYALIRSIEADKPSLNNHKVFLLSDMYPSGTSIVYMDRYVRRLKELAGIMDSIIREFDPTKPYVDRLAGDNPSIEELEEIIDGYLHAMRFIYQKISYYTVASKL